MMWQLPRAYLDTNIFDYVVQADSADAFVELLDRRELTVLLSDIHLAETLAIRDRDLRDARLRLMHTLIRETPSQVGDLLSQELVTEVERVRPQWIRKFPDTSKIHRYRNHYRRHWQLLRDPPHWLARNSQKFLELAESGIEQNRHAQKGTREALVKQEAGKLVGLQLQGASIDVSSLDLLDPVDGWRLDQLQTWAVALLPPRDPRSRDFFDYAGPYLQLNAISVRKLAEFWFVDADPTRMPRSWCASWVAHAQVQSQIRRGNSLDATHASFMVDADLFLTADRPFFKTLNGLVSTVEGAAHPMYVDRRLANPIHAITRVLEEGAA